MGNFEGSYAYKALYKNVKNVSSTHTLSKFKDFPIDAPRKRNLIMGSLNLNGRKHQTRQFYKYLFFPPGNILCISGSFIYKISYVYESIQRGNFGKYLFLGVWSPGKSYLFLQNFEKALENLICSYGLMVFLSLGKSYVF